MLQRKSALEQLKNRLISAENLQISRKNQRFVALTAKLDAMSPLKVLTRGYAMVQDGQQQVVRSVTQLHQGQILDISMADGQFTAQVHEIKERTE